MPEPLLLTSAGYALFNSMAVISTFGGTVTGGTVAGGTAIAGGTAVTGTAVAGTAVAGGIISVFPPAWAVGGGIIVGIILCKKYKKSDDPDDSDSDDPKETKEEKKEETNKEIPDKKKEISKSIMGQEIAVECVSNKIQMINKNLTKKIKPEVMMFVGPSGVGKTEMCRVIARNINYDLKIINMSNYISKESTWTLFGSSTGYKGGEGILPLYIENHKKSIVVFDEIEKANDKIYETLLSVFDTGVISSNKGKDIISTDVLYIMTSNACQEDIGRYIKNIDMEKFSIIDEKFRIIDKFQNIAPRILKKEFKRWEFLGRIDTFVPFGYISDDSLNKIIETKLKTYFNYTKSNRYKFRWNDDVVNHIKSTALTNKELGVRGIQNIIGRFVQRAVVDIKYNRFKVCVIDLRKYMC